MRCLLWKAFTLVSILPYFITEQRASLQKKIIDLLQIQLQPVEHRLQPGWELHCHHHRHHRYRPRHLHQILPLK